MGFRVGRDITTNTAGLDATARKGCSMAKRFINNPDDIVTEMLEGMTAAWSDTIELAKENGRVIVSKAFHGADRVGVIAFGGSGHEPAVVGLVGDGMLDVAAVGEVFAAPGPQDVFDAVRIADHGQGVLMIILNHTGDMMSSDSALNMAERENIRVRRVICRDDISKYSRENISDRRGLGGATFLFHIAGAAAREGMSLDEVGDIVQHVADNMATLAVANVGATHPTTGLLIATFGENEMEIGIGNHGESGGIRLAMEPADVLTDRLMKMILQDLDMKAGEMAALMVNGTGSTTLMELSIIFRRASQILEESGVQMIASCLDSIFTTQEQAGFHLSVCRMNDTERRLWAAPCCAPCFKQ